MSVAAAIRISSPHEAHVIRHAASFATGEQAQCYVIAVVDELPYGRGAEDARDAVRDNLALIEEVHACALLQEGDDVASTLVAVGSGFGVTTLFLQPGTRRLLGRSVAERLLYLNPPFDVVIVGEDGVSAKRSLIPR